MAHHGKEGGDIRARIADCIHHLEHVLPSQASIRDFVHHNTLHGFQHLPFPEALAAAHRLTGAMPYLSEGRFGEFLAEGRIHLEDLDAALDAPGEAVGAVDLVERQGRARLGDRPHLPLQTAALART